ncbi:hypothetical protein CDG76_28800 [Nostoc sp. 'Peltigera membranacea cyanobiont' 210A]|nr:hypothetical protein CDG76_28800 [Nostoc sp. 'Peltigera membranacea cyanobiont' 210A]
MIATDGKLKHLSNGCFTIQNRSTERLVPSGAEVSRSLKSKMVLDVPLQMKLVLAGVEVIKDFTVFN